MAAEVVCPVTGMGKQRELLIPGTAEKRRNLAEFGN
jgi:hypothetical protein